MGNPGNVDPGNVNPVNVNYQGQAEINTDRPKRNWWRISGLLFVLATVAIVSGIVGYQYANLHHSNEIAERNDIMSSFHAGNILIKEADADFGVMLIHLVADATYFCDPRSPIDAIQETQAPESKLSQDDYLKKVLTYIDPEQFQSLTAAALYQSVRASTDDCHANEMELFAQRVSEVE